MGRPETVFEWLARRRNVTVEEMRAYLLARIAEGWNSLDPVCREPWLRYTVEKIKADGRGDLLYLPDDWEG